MHEVSLCESVLRIIQKQAEKDGFKRVVKVTLTVGEHSGASTEAMAFCFPFVVKGSVADGAELAFVPGKGRDLRVKALEVA